MFVFSKKLMSNGRPNICYMGIENGGHERNILGVENCISTDILKGSVGVNRRDRAISPEVVGVLLYNFLSSYMPYYY
jgi:hypothetical protein